MHVRSIAARGRCSAVRKRPPGSRVRFVITVSVWPQSLATLAAVARRGSELPRSAVAVSQISIAAALREGRVGLRSVCWEETENKGLESLQ